MSKQSTMVYRSLIFDALRVTWERKSLWIFGIFAALVFSGGIVDVAVSGIKKATVTGTFLESLLDRSFIGYAYASQFLLQLKKIDVAQFKFFLILSTLLVIGLFCAGIISQAALVHGCQNHIRHSKLLRHHALVHFWNVFSINLIGKMLNLLLVGLTALPVFLFLTKNDPVSSNLLFIHFFLFIPAVIILQILIILSIIAAVQENLRTLPAITRALSIFKTHWLATIEYGFILFFMVCGASILFAGLLTLISVPTSWLYHMLLTSAIFPSYFLIPTSYFFFFSLLLTFAGIVVTFQYVAWHAFFKRATHSTFGLKPFSKIWRALFT